MTDPTGTYQFTFDNMERFGGQFLIPKDFYR